MKYFKALIRSAIGPHLARATQLIFVMVFVQGLLGCNVELRDKNKGPGPKNELVVDQEYAVPVPLIQSRQATLHYDRLVLRKDAKFITNGLNLRLEVDELVSEGGTIASFPDNLVTPVGQDGKSGGNLEMTVGHATGRLHLALRGADGGKGHDGLPPTEAMRGSKGTRGADCHLDGKSLRCMWGTNGGPGGDGLPGYPGEHGFKGGNSGSVALTVGSADDFDILISKVPGKGGAGGIGGDGGAPGAPGDRGLDLYPGFPTITAPTMPTVDGPPGNPGKRGPSGEAGAAGIIEKVCVILPKTEPKCEASAQPTLNGEYKPFDDILKLFPEMISSPPPAAPKIN